MGKAFFRKFKSEVLAGTVSQICGLVIFILLYDFLGSVGIYIEPFGDRSGIYLGVLFVLPFCCLMGIIYIDYARYKNRKWILLGTILALISSIPISVGTIILIDNNYGFASLIISLVGVPLVATIVYNLPQRNT